MPQTFVANAVIRWVEKLPGFPKLRVLDLSCGEGEILQKLQAQGCTVQGTHFREDDYIVQTRERLTGIPIQDGVNLHEPLPFDTAGFDVIIMSEVLEHLEWHGAVVREVGRILRPGGYFVFTTPNIQRLHSRLQFFLTGKHKLIRRRTGWDLQPGDLYAYHITPVDFPLMHTFLHQAGLTIVDLPYTKVKPFKTALFGLLYPLVWLSCRLTHQRKVDASEPFVSGESDLNSWLCHPAVLFSEQLFVLARKTGKS